MEQNFAFEGGLRGMLFRGAASLAADWRRIAVAWATRYCVPVKTLPVRGKTEVSRPSTVGANLLAEFLGGGGDVLSLGHGGDHGGVAGALA